MSPTPLYQPRSDDGAYQLRYSWTGWPAGGSFAARPERVIEESKPLWERDGLRVLEHRWTDALVQILFSARPDVSPEVMAARAKGRLDHALRAAKVQMPFSRKVALRAVGDNTSRDIEAYQNNLASMTGQGRIWSDGFYVGTFGDYAMSAVRGRASTTAWAGLNEERGTV